MSVKTILVVGSGAMGNGIAQTCAVAGYDVIMEDVAEEFVERGLATIKTSLARFVKSGKIAEGDLSQILERIHGSTSVPESAPKADFVIEAIPEIPDLKMKMFAELDSLCDPKVVLASNTSQISITAIGAATKHPDRVVGMHFFNPAPVMKLVEVVRGLRTAEATVEATRELAVAIGKDPVVCRDSQGFIVNRAMLVFLAECVRMLEEGVGTKEDIDKAIKLGLNHPMGPFELMDLTGVDIVHHAANGLQEVLGERFRAPQLISQMVEAGLIGRKTGAGFYDYSKK